MSKYLEELFEIYLTLKEEQDIDQNITGKYDMFKKEIEKDKTIKYSFTPINQKFETGELYFVDNFIFLLIGEFEENYYTGYKVSEWVEFATYEDFIFEFNEDKWLAIMEKLFIPKEKLGSYIGKISEKYVNILFDFEFKDKKIPEEYTGLTVPKNSIQYRFREIELKEVAPYIFTQFKAIEEAIDYYEKNILSLDDFRKKFNKSLQKVHFQKAAHTGFKTASGNHFKLHYDQSKNILTLILNDKIKTPGVVKLRIYDSIYLFFAEDNIITVDVTIDYLNVRQLAENMEILND